ncbi:MAG: histidine triad nucleotide-binding protein [Chloroflexi bacterium]|nr:histidine triad nucleotide-binding protein [Chloroflexota bacterium]
MAEASGERYDSNNVFARILRGEIPSDRVYEDGECVAFRDIEPAAPTHILLIPRRAGPVSTVGLADEDAGWLGRLIVRAARIAAEQGLAERGYRLVLNTGRDAGQTVWHLHLHILGGVELGPFA